VRKDVDIIVATMTILGANWPYRWYSPRGALSSAEIVEQIATS
jgi:hypothetical protein